MSDDQTPPSSAQAGDIPEAGLNGAGAGGDQPAGAEPAEPAAVEPTGAEPTGDAGAEPAPAGAPAGSGDDAGAEPAPAGAPAGSGDDAGAEPAPAGAPAGSGDEPAKAAEVASGGAPGGARSGRPRGGRSGRPSGKRAYDAADLANLPVPDELLKFNALILAERQSKGREKKERRAEEAKARLLADAEKAKDAAAARVRKLQSDPKASREDKDSADRAYKEALAALADVRAGKVPAPAANGKPEEGDTATPADAEVTAEGAQPAGEQEQEPPQGEEGAAGDGEPSEVHA